MVLIYCPIITPLSGRTGGNKRGRDKGRGGERVQNRDKQREREGLIDKEGG